MNIGKKDKQIIKDVSLVAADEIVSSIPGLNLPWKLSKALFGAGMKIRQQKVLEWVEMVRDNPSIFTKEILESRQFQDGFVYALERYIRERNESKRKIMKNIFLGFVGINSEDNFELERMYHVLSILSIDDLLVLKNVDITRDELHQIYEETKEKNENIYNLISTGILISDYSSRIGPIAAPFVKITKLGKEFIKYVEK